MRPAARKRQAAPVDPHLLQMAHLHILSARHTTPTLAKRLRVSTATAFRIVKRLRASGVRIVSVKDGRAWFFEVRADFRRAWETDPLLRAIGSAKGRRRKGQSVDDVLYGMRRRPS